MRLADLNITRIRKVAGLSIHFIDPQTVKYHLCVLVRKGSSILVEENHEEVESIEEVAEKLPKNVPVVLTISGRNILNKDVPKDEFESVKQQYFPETEESDFYGNALDFEEHSYLSICRKSIIDPILEELEKNKIIIANLSIGAYTAIAYWSFRLTESKELHLGESVLTLNSEGKKVKLSSGNTSNSSLNIYGDELPSLLLLPYIGALTYLLKSKSVIPVGEVSTSIVKDFQYKHLMDVLKIPALAVVFLMLLINYFVFDSFRKKDTVLGGQLNMNAGIISKLDSLDKELKAKEDYIAFIGNNKTYFSLQLDEIGQSVPSGIILNTLTINPTINKMKEGETIELKKGIELSGTARTSLVVNEWTKELSDIDWIRDVVVVDYHKDLNNLRGEFIIHIELKE